jgi:hypothetical protein
MFVSNNAAALIFYLVEGAECSYNIDRLMMIRMRLSFSFFFSLVFLRVFLVVLLVTGECRWIRSQEIVECDE